LKDDDDKFKVWKWFQINILDSDIKYFYSSKGIALFWLFNRIALKYEKEITNKNSEKLKDIVKDPLFNLKICTLPKIDFKDDDVTNDDK